RQPGRPVAAPARAPLPAGARPPGAGPVPAAAHGQGPPAAAADRTQRHRSRLLLRLPLARILLAALPRPVRLPAQRRPPPVDHRPGAAAEAGPPGPFIDRAFREFLICG